MLGRNGRAALVLISLSALGAAWLVARSGFSLVAAGNALATVREPVAAQLASSPVGAAAAAALIALGLATLWSAGVRGWFAPLRHGPRTVPP
jgi:hypothetical protein